MNFFASIYEDLFGVFNSKFSLIFRTLSEEGGYIFLGLGFVFIPLILWLVFYLLWNYPYGRVYHWLIWLAIIFFVVGAISWIIADSAIFASNNQALFNAISDPHTGYGNYARSLPIKYAIINSVLSVPLGFLYSLAIKRFSKLQIHLPF